MKNPRSVVGPKVFPVRFRHVFNQAFIACLLLAGCSGFYTTHPVADQEMSRIDQRLLGTWQLKFESGKAPWRLSFHSDDKIVGKLILLRYDWSRAQYNQTHVFPVHCLRDGDHGTCSAKLDGSPLPNVKQDMRGGFVFNFGTMTPPDPDENYVVARYEIFSTGDVAIFSDAKIKAIKQRLKAQDFSSIDEKKRFIITEPTLGLVELLKKSDQLFKANPTILTQVKELTIDQKVAKLIKQLQTGSSKHRYNSALKLGELGKQAAGAVPVLNKILWNTLESAQAVDPPLVRAVVESLGHIGVTSPETLAALKALQELAEPDLTPSIEKTIRVLKQAPVNNQRND